MLFYNARYYDSLIGRFVSADTLVPGAGNPQALNRYSYVYGRPTSLTDPGGHVPCSVKSSTPIPDCDVDGWTGKPKPNIPPHNLPIADWGKTPIGMTDIAWREERTETVVGWLKSYEGPAWWKGQDGNLDFEKIRAWILYREVGNMWDAPGILEFFAGIINARLSGGIDDIRALAAFTPFFNPDIVTGRDRNTFDMGDWARWLEAPDQMFIDAIHNTPASSSNLQYWWDPRETTLATNQADLVFESPSSHVVLYVGDLESCRASAPTVCH